MLSSRVCRLRTELIEFHRAGVPLDGTALGSVILAILLIEGLVRDLEERLPAASTAAPQPPTNVVPFVPKSQN